jgi:hypothetical protein
MYTIFSAVLRQQRKSDVMTYFGHSARSAVYYKVYVSHYLERKKQPQTTPKLIGVLAYSKAHMYLFTL